MVRLFWLLSIITTTTIFWLPSTTTVTSFSFIPTSKIMRNFVPSRSANDSYDLNKDYVQTKINDSASNIKHEEDRFKRRSKSSTHLPEFSSPIGNVTAVLGRDVRLICTVEHLGSYQVAWLKEETNTIISIDTNIIITNYRIFLIPDEEERKWVLHIKDVQESDRGFYQCQVNTSPMRSTSGYLEVVVPPTIIETQTTQVAEVIEHSNISIQCRASGHPKPNIVWHRDDGAPIRLTGQFLNEALNVANENRDSSNNKQSTYTIQPTLTTPELYDVRSDKLSLFDVDRSMTGIYVCVAANGIPLDANKRIPLYVKFAPKTSVQNKYLSVNIGDQLEIECVVEAFPKPNSYWSRSSSGKQSMQRVEAIRWSLHNDIGGALSPRSKQSGQKVRLNSSSLAIDDAAREQMEEKSNQPQLIMSGHPHNRIKFKRQTTNSEYQEQISVGNNFHSSTQGPYTGRQYRTQTSVDTYWDQQPAVGRFAATQEARVSSSGALVTVKQIAVNPYTYKLRMTITKMQLEDYGKYICIASNSLGTSETSVIVTKPDLTAERNRNYQNSNSEYKSLDEGEYQRDSLSEQQNGMRRSSSSSGNRVVYDENYLQAIKSRQNNIAGTSRLQQRQKSKVGNSACFSLSGSKGIVKILSGFLLLLLTRKLV